jgi:hypothetical protein
MSKETVTGRPTVQLIFTSASWTCIADVDLAMRGARREKDVEKVIGVNNVDGEKGLFVYDKRGENLKG